MRSLWLRSDWSLKNQAEQEMAAPSASVDAKERRQKLKDEDKVLTVKLTLILPPSLNPHPSPCAFAAPF